MEEARAPRGGPARAGARGGGGAGGAEPPAERLRQVVEALAPQALCTEGARHGGEVGVGEIHLAVFPEDPFLEILDGAVALVVGHEEDDAGALLPRRGPPG